MMQTNVGSWLEPVRVLRTNRWLSLWLLANGVSQLGNQVYGLAIPWLAMSMTGSALYMNAVWAVEMLPFLVVGPFMGALVDRLDRRKVMVVADLCQAVLVTAIPALHILGLLRPWQLFVVGFLLNCFAIAYNLVADFGVIPRLAQGTDLAVANSIHFTIVNLAGVLGAAVGGFLITWLTAPGALIFDALSFLATMAVTMLLPIDFGSRAEAGPLSFTTVAGEMAEGFRFMWRDGVIRSLALGLSILNLASGALFTTMTYHLGQEWKLPADQVGLGYSVMGFAAVIGSLIAPAVIRRHAIGKVVVLCVLVEAMGGVAMALSGHWAMALAGFGVQTLVGTVTNISTFTIRQKAIPNQLMGRVNAAFRTLLTLSFPLSAALLGMVTEKAGARASFGLSTVILGAAFLMLLLSPASRYRLPQDDG
jgi:MFS family permease